MWQKGMDIEMMESREKIFGELKQVLREILDDLANDLSYETSLFNDLGLSSLEYITLIVGIEERFKIHLNIESIWFDPDMQVKDLVESIFKAIYKEETQE